MGIFEINRKFLEASEETVSKTISDLQRENAELQGSLKKAIEALKELRSIVDRLREEAYALEIKNDLA